MKRSGVYRITNTVNGKVYIGSSEDAGHRFVAHRYLLRNGKHHARGLQRAYDKHGEAAFAFDMIEEVAVPMLLVREQHWMDHHRSTNSRRGYNICPAAGNRKGSTQPASVAETMRAFHTGKPKSQDHRSKIAAAHLGRPKHTAASRTLIADAVRTAMTPERRETSRRLMAELNRRRYSKEPI